MWGWLDGVVSGLKSIWETLVNLDKAIVGGIKGFFEDIQDAIFNLDDLIIDGIKSIFVPDTNYIETALNSFTEELKLKFNIDTSAFESLFQNEQPVEDVYTDYEISGVGTFKFKLLDTSYLKDALETFRPIIRGFLVLLMLLYNIKQLIGFFGYDAGVVAGRSEWIAYNKADTGGHKNE